MKRISGVHKTLKLSSWVITLHFELFGLLFSFIFHGFKIGIHFGLESGEFQTGALHIIVRGIFGSLRKISRNWWSISRGSLSGFFFSWSSLCGLFLCWSSLCGLFLCWSCFSSFSSRSLGSWLSFFSSLSCWLSLCSLFLCYLISLLCLNGLRIIFIVKKTFQALSIKLNQLTSTKKRWLLFRHSEK